MPQNSSRDAILAVLARALKKPVSEIDALLTVPPQQEFGDFALPCFFLAKELKKAPQMIAQDITASLSGLKIKGVARIEAQGPYVNFFVERTAHAEKILSTVRAAKDRYGMTKLSQKEAQRTMLEFFHANTHKGVHIGHIRNISMGAALCNILESAGHTVIRVNFQGDIGPHVAKCLWGYVHRADFGEKLPKNERGVWLGKIYALAHNRSKDDPQIEAEIRDINTAIYAGDKKWVKIWKETRNYCLKDFESLYKEYRVHFDRLYFESETEGIGKIFVQKLLAKGIAQKSEGAIVMDLKEYDLGVFVLLTSEGHALYSTKDLGLAELKQKEYGAKTITNARGKGRGVDKSLHLVGSEQEMHFKQLFKTLELAHHPFAHKSQHLSYGLVMLPEGKMSSREGTMVLYEDLKQKLFHAAEREIKQRYPTLGKKEIDKRKRIISMSALKFSMINREFARPVIFDWDTALDFEGETGPYVQYAYARIQSIRKKFGKTLPRRADFGLLTDPHEHTLVTLLANFPSVIQEAAEKYKPSLICRALVDLAQRFNEYYHRCQILQDDAKLRDARLLLVLAVAQVLKNGLALLGIEVLDEM